MKVKWFGHASFLIIAKDGTRIITDPYEPGFRNIINYAKIDEEADIVTSSHDHGDHNYLGDIRGKPQVVKGPGTHHAKGIEFKGVATYHDASQGSERGSNTIFCFTVDGMRICHLGDLGHALSSDQVAELGKVDILFLPIGGPAATLELDKATKLCDSLAPKIVFPMHYKTDKCSFPMHSVDDFIKGRRNVKQVKAAEVEVTKLPATTETFVLEHAR